MNATTWNQRVLTEHGSILQSWEWGQVQQAAGHTVHRLEVRNTLAQIIVMPTVFGRTLLFSPYGPVGKITPALAADWRAVLLPLAKQHRALAWRYENGGASLGGKLVATVHPQRTWITSLVEPEQLRQQFKAKWRYNIGVAERHGVTVRASINPVDVTLFYSLLQTTAQRQGIRLHAESYYRLILETLATTNQAKLYFAEYQDKPIAAALVVYWGKTAIYLHGGSDYATRAVMAPHLLHWQIMQDSFVAGYTQYDWFGIASSMQANDPWAGITRFKQGFGGEAVDYAGTYELPLDPVWYTIYRGLKFVRQLWT